MTDDYSDIINLPHHVSKVHPPQPMEKRAAQFSPFAALTGYDDAVEETARYTDSKQELEDEDKAKINAALNALQGRIREQPAVLLESFVPDPKKRGGRYVSTEAAVKKLDPVHRILTLSDGKRIPFDDLFALEPLAPEDEPFGAL